MRSPDINEIPEELAHTAFRNGNEMAWKQGDCPAVIEWLRSAGHAVLGTELWCLNGTDLYTAIGTKSGPLIYCTACDPAQNERWSDYVQRSATAAINWIASFRWPEDSIEPPDPVYFNITWADRKWFSEHSDAKFGDD
jgi:hypothetical protein